VGVRAVSVPAVFLDRDGTLVRTLVSNGVPRPVERVADLEILPGVADALARLHEAGFALVVVTNQPDVARGTVDRRVVEQMHAQLRGALPIDAIECCYHDDADACGCRKPQPGMLIDAAARLDILLNDSFVVGDRWRDVEAGKRAGCTTILLRQPYSGDNVQSDFEASDFSEAAEIILRTWEERT
jgi:D-glycero-D-manno-heptose 1,7-bisphosphate phosphatase